MHMGYPSLDEPVWGTAVCAHMWSVGLQVMLMQRGKLQAGTQPSWEGPLSDQEGRQSSHGMAWPLLTCEVVQVLSSDSFAGKPESG